MYYYKTKNVNIIGSSPEMLVRVTGNQIETFPIAGTRPRDEDEEKNKQLTDELLSDEKERAEHVMLVDLARNDVGQIAKFGSVKVPEFMQVHQFSHVQHIVSKVIGELKKDRDCFDAIRAIFPAGTVSGAPKIRAMQIIQELEEESRGPYAGALGYFSKNMCADFAITIRTLVVKGNDAYIQAGAGIVADSIPEREWFETEQKASALIAALEMAKKGASVK
jgi:anthranilate synthase component 1